MSKIKFPNTIDSAAFYKEVTRLVNETELNYFDAIVYYCERNNLEMETAAALVKGNFRLKSHLQEDCERLNIVQKKSKLSS